jgi:ribosomal protein S8
MAFEQLSVDEQRIVLQCMKIIYDEKYIEEWETQTRIGIDRNSLLHVINVWPNLDDSENDSDVTLAINNCMNEICNGINISEEDREQYFKTTGENIKKTYEHWKILRLGKRE